jgi:hypothetical protein
MTEPQICKSCGQPYEFVETVTGKMMPIDAEPNPAGNILIVDGKADVLKKGDPRWASVPADERRMSHFATCAYARDYRKRHPVEKGS